MHAETEIMLRTLIQILAFISGRGSCSLVRYSWRIRISSYGLYNRNATQRNVTQRNATLGILSIYCIVCYQTSHCNSEMFYWAWIERIIEIVKSDYCNAILYRVVEKNHVFTGTSYIQCDTFSFSFFFLLSLAENEIERQVIQ